MAHELDNTKGFYGFLSLEKTAWHGLGTVITEHPKKMKDILVPAGLDFEVNMLPNILRLPDGTEIQTEYYSTFRIDKIGKETKYSVLGSGMKEGYHILQNEEALSILEPFFKNSKITFETAGSLKGGKWTFVCCKFNAPIQVDKKDIVDNYFCIFNSFDGSLSLMAYFTPVRVVCNNTLQMSFRNCKQKITLRHTANLKNRMEEATRILIAAEENGKHFAEQAAKMKKDSWKENRFFDYVASVYCTPDEIKQIKTGHPIADILSTRKRNIISETVDFAYSGIGQPEAGEGSAWWAYNAVTGFYSNAKKFSSEEARAESLYFGGSSRILENALVLAANPEKVQRLDINPN